MADLGEKMTDDRVDRIRSELGKMYSEAARDLQKKVNEYTKRYEAKDKEKRAAVAAGKLSEDDYKRWLKGQVFIGGQWNAKVSQMAKSLVNVEKEAVKVVHGEQVECFAEQANYFEFRIDKDHDFGMNFGLYDTHTVTRLVRDEPELLRRRYVDGVASEAWNVKTIRNCIMQGILQGESIPDIAKRMARDTASSDMKAMTRYARTAMTGAQNAGRLQAMRESKKKGIYCKKLWISALDDRTREAHIDLNGQTADVDKPFDSMLGPIMFPGDPNASDENVWNCRCALGYEYPDNADSDSIEEYEDEEEEFKDWEDEKIEEPSSIFVQGKDITFTQKDAYTESEKDAIHEYTTSLYSGVNSALREGTVKDYESVKRIVDEIDSAMKKTVVSEGTVASRGASMDDLRGMFEGKRRSWFEDPENLKSLEGQTATFKSYLSTTKGESVAEPYKRELQWHFTTEGKVHGIDAEQFASSSVKPEREILFDRNAQIEIKEVKVNVDSDGDIDGVVEIWAKIKGK